MKENKREELGCRICGTPTRNTYNISFAPVPICEACGWSVTKQTVIHAAGGEQPTPQGQGNLSGEKLYRLTENQLFQIYSEGVNKGYFFSGKPFAEIIKEHSTPQEQGLPEDWENRFDEWKDAEFSPKPLYGGQRFGAAAAKEWMLTQLQHPTPQGPPILVPPAADPGTLAFFWCIAQADDKDRCDTQCTRCAHLEAESPNK